MTKDDLNEICEAVKEAVRKEFREQEALSELSIRACEIAVRNISGAVLNVGYKRISQKALEQGQ